jgi:hypothetical protein
MQEDIRRYRALALLCRQQAVFHPEERWKWLGEAERFEHLAETPGDVCFRECNANAPKGDLVA